MHLQRSSLDVPPLLYSVRSPAVHNSAVQCTTHNTVSVGMSASMSQTVSGKVRFKAQHGHSVEHVITLSTRKSTQLKLRCKDVACWYMNTAQLSSTSQSRSAEGRTMNEMQTGCITQPNTFNHSTVVRASHTLLHAQS